MFRENSTYSDALQDIKAVTDKIELGICDVMRIVGISYNRASRHYMQGKKKITIYQLAMKLTN